MIRKQNLIRLLENFNGIKQSLKDLGGVTWTAYNIQFSTHPLIELASRYDSDVCVTKSGDDMYPYRTTLYLEKGYSLFSLTTQEEYEQLNLERYLVESEEE